MKHFALIAAILIALFAIACGGDDDDDDDGGGDSTPTATAMATETGDDDDGDAGDDDDAAGDDDDDAGGSGLAGDRAIVTIGDTTWEFDMSGSLATCIALGGAIGAVGPAADGSEVSVDLTLPPENWESLNDEWDPPSIRLRDRVNDVDWRAGGDIVVDFIASGQLEEGTSQVDSYQIDGGRASGTATFVDIGVGEPATGSFEVNCG